MTDMGNIPFPHVAAVVLAAGKGKRMKSDRAKVLHEILGKSMISYVLEAATAVFGRNIVVVIGHQGEAVRAAIEKDFSPRFVRQQEQKGTGHAVLTAEPEIPADCDDVVVLCGDVPVVQSETLVRFVHEHVEACRDVTVLAARLEDPTGYGRLLIDRNSGFYGIVEEADATEKQKRIDLINTGIYCVKKSVLFEMLGEVSGENAQGEFYLTDIIGIGYRRGLRMGMVTADDAFEFTGVNSIDELRAVEQRLRRRESNKA